VAAEGATVAVQVWDRLEAQAGSGAMYAAFARHLGPAAAGLDGAYWALGDLELLGSLVEVAGLGVTGIRTRVGTARFGSAAEAVATELDATPLAARLDQDARRHVLEAGVAAMGPFVVAGGRVELPIRGHLVTAAAPGWARAARGRRMGQDPGEAATTWEPPWT